ncbi:ParB/RepB/Spo0J family partition protein [Polaromonas sp. CG_9.5]|uniref:ParB/RepB/Spo0J family partition protein n=1 Tax=Polaromonas sp. CG_9.5 TaxID=3071705 RepID=UPI002DFAE934|nr:ParB/RepB/Spo0J family partition protein [Polaromonas sp. CG_9.5]
MSLKEYAADNGQQLPTQPLPTIDQFAHIETRQIVASLTNPRTTFNQPKLQELADSIAATGVHQPILVRPLPGSRVSETDRFVEYEVVAGERRFRACTMAELKTIPAMIRAMTDGEVLEVQIIENLIRDDLTELEEAQGYDRLMQHSSLSADAVGAKIGKSRSYVYARLKLLDLAGECQQALRDGNLDASKALLLARIPDHKLQLKALKEATELRGGETCSLRSLQIWLQQNVMLPLERAPFQITDARLVEVAGSCTSCPKRTGAAPDIFADVSGADICTDPPCYQNKASAHQLRNLTKAEGKGMRLISGTEAKTICYEKSNTLNGYSALSQVRADAGGERLDTLLGEGFEGAVLIENPWTHALIEAVPTAEAEGVLLARGLIKADVAKQGKAERVDAQIEQIKKATAREIENGFREAAYAAIAGRIMATPDALASDLLSPALLRAWLINLIDNTPSKEMAKWLQMTLPEDQPESQREEAVRLRIQATSGAMLYRAMAMAMIAEDRYFFGPLQDTNPTPIFAAIAAPHCIDLPALRADVTKTVKADVSARIAALKALNKPEKPPVPTAPLAQPDTAPVAGAKPGKAQSAPAALRKPRLSAKEAQSGIAQAMQGIEAGQVPCPVAPGGDTAQAQTPGQQVNSLEPIQGTLPVGVVALGQRVKVLVNVNTQQSKWIGKTGTVTAKMGDTGCDVTFRGRAGGIASFDVTEIEVVA